MHRRHFPIVPAALALVTLCPAYSFAGGRLAGTVPSGRSSTAAGAKRILFVSNLIGSVRMYTADIHQSNPQLLGSITTGLVRPEGVWIDRKGSLYVVNAEGGNNVPNVVEYKHGATTPSLTITDGLFSPATVAVGRDGTVYVNAVSQGTTGEVVEYAPGATTPERTIALPSPQYDLEPGDLAFDKNGNLLAATLGPIGNVVHVFKIAPGSSQAVDLGLQGAGGACIGVDGEGNLYAGGTNFFVAVYPPGSNAPSRTFSLNLFSFFPYGLTVGRDGTVYVTGSSEVVEFAPGASTPTNYIDTEYGETFTYDATIGLQW